MLLGGFAPKEHCSLGWPTRWIITRTTKHWKSGPGGKAFILDTLDVCRHRLMYRISWHRTRANRSNAIFLLLSIRSYHRKAHTTHAHLLLFVKKALALLCMFMFCNLEMQGRDRCTVSSWWLACLHRSVTVKGTGLCHCFDYSDRSYCFIHYHGPFG